MPFVYFKQTSIYYEKIGKGKPILFIHPPGLGRVVFQYQKPLASYFQLIFPDLSGHGKSSYSADNHVSLVDQYIEEIHQIVLQEKLDKVILCAYSAGGSIAQAFAIHYPTYVEAMIISGAYPKVDTFGLNAMYLFGQSILPNHKRIFAKLLAQSNSNSTVDQQKLYLHILQSNTTRWLQFYQVTKTLDFVPDLIKLKCPCLLVYGQYSNWIHHHKLFYQSLHNVQIAFVNRAFHQVPSKNYLQFNQLVVQFLRPYLTEDSLNFR